MKISRLALSAALAAAACGALVAPGAMAADGTITFSGKIIGTTCSVAGGNNLTVTLPVVTTDAFGTAGNITTGTAIGDTNFHIGLTGCPTSPVVKVAASFSGDHIDASNGGTLNDTGVSGVNVALYQGGNLIDLGTDNGVTSGSYVTIASNGTATLNYTAKYYATAATVGTGDVKTTVDYTLVYQ